MIPLRAALIAAVLAFSSASAAPVFFGVATVGLEPPPAFRASGDSFRKGAASIAMVGVLAEAYACAIADRAHLAASEADSDAKIDAFSAGGGNGFIICGRRAIGGIDYRVGVVLVGTPKQSAMVGVYVPLSDTETNDAAIEAALKTIALRDRSGFDAEMAALPFVFGDLSGIHVFHYTVEASALRLDVATGDVQAILHIFIRADPFVKAGDEASARFLAAQFLWARYGIKPLERTEPKLYAALGGRYVELRGEKPSDASREVTDVVFLTRYDASGAFEIACTAPHPMSASLVERCRTLAFSVRPRS